VPRSKRGGAGDDAASSGGTDSEVVPEAEAASDVEVEVGDSDSDSDEQPIPDDREAARMVLGWQSGAWIAGGLFVSFVLVGLLRNIPSGLVSVGVGVLLAFALDPLVVRIRARTGWKRPGAVAAVSGVFALVFAFLVVVLGPAAVDQAGDFGSELPETVEAFYDLPIIGSRLEEADAAGKVQEWVDELPARIDEEAIEDVARRVVGGLMSAFIVLLIGVTVLVDGDKLVRRMLDAIPDKFEPVFVRGGRIFYRTIGAYFSGSVLVAACAATFILTVGLALGVPLAPAAALWALAVNLIPQIGGFLTGSFFTILGLAKSPMTGLACAVLYIIWMNFENHILGPAIVGDAVDLSPPTTMLAALIGGAAAGVPGALVATPLVGAVKAIYLEVRYGQRPQKKRVAPWDKLPFVKKRRTAAAS
jgi:putative heme transporter